VAPAENPIGNTAATKGTSTKDAAVKPVDKFERIELKTLDKQAISGSFFAPRKKGRAPAALLVHEAGRDRATLNALAETLQKRGFAVLTIDLRGHGDSVSETWDWSKMTEAEDQKRSWTFAMRDLEAATEWLRDRKDVHNSNLSLVGVGAGAVLAVRYAVRDENARAVVLIKPDPQAFGFDMLKDVKALGGLPTLIMGTSEDRPIATRIQKASTKANEGLEYVHFKALKLKDATNVFSDKRLPRELTDFLREEAMPRR